MEYRIFRGSAVNNLRTYMSVNMGREVITSPDMFCLCAMERGKIAGVGVFEAGQMARLYEINVLARYKNKGVEQDILLAVCQTLTDAGSEGVMMKVHEDDGFAFWEPLLLRNSFTMGRTAAFFQFLLVEAYASPIIRKAVCPPAIITLGQTSERQRNDYSGRLRDRRQFIFLNDESIAGDLSAVYMQDNRIGGCFLVSEFKDIVSPKGDKESGIYVEYASTRDVADPLALVEMIRFSMERVWKRHVPDEHGYILSMDRTVEAIFKKMFPGGQMAGRVEEFTLIFK